MRRLLLTLTMLGIAAYAQAQTQGAGLRIGMRDDPDILDPTLSRTYVGTLVMTAMCDKLFDFDAKQAIVPVLATGYEQVDPVTLLIRLRPGVQFQDGEKFDAAAVKYGLERHVNLPGSFRRNEIGAMERVEVVDPLTVRVVLKQPFSPFIAVLTDRAGMMVSPKAAEAAGKDFGLHPVCAGPFRFVERVAQDRIVLERFPGYWDAGRIHYDRVTYRVMPDSSIRLANLKAGALDTAEVAPLDVQAAKADPKLAVVDVAGLGYGALTVNLAGTTPMARDQRVRAAFQLALDRAALSQVVFAGMYAPVAQAISASSPYYAPDVPMPPHDVAAARALLQQAGVAAPLRVELLVYNTPQGVQAGEVIQAMAAEAGFDVRRDRGGVRRGAGGDDAGGVRPHAGRLVWAAGPGQQLLCVPAHRQRPEHRQVLEPEGGCAAGAGPGGGRPGEAAGDVWRALDAGAGGPAADLSVDDPEHPGDVTQGARGDAAGERAFAAAGYQAGPLRGGARRAFAAARYLPVTRLTLRASPSFVRLSAFTSVPCNLALSLRAACGMAIQGQQG